ncbi:11359_t:CDS:2 [Dentiscutata heterogama]|uniref:11359_t:CDS:1 n=1 Tax=Dentiscutata heterogama TaxID=1316150 RepID=A0ACA9M0J2_9GLOM|nr:11359_t:CDS:2 [Dentiscutata heterogama]
MSDKSDKNPYSLSKFSSSKSRVNLDNQYVESELEVLDDF